MKAANPLLFADLAFPNVDNTYQANPLTARAQHTLELRILLA